uniref:Nicotinate-nucleotide pyrophosphorylase [carboxylating] n=1 Tax=Fibrocapsa japonica TaxID=94617 RepID=A0A7S2XY56_9STRA|mmetsp:Transcript_21189/g.30722  ORF Transcript_21189/g.30722 Transcript_21189/m.30722 type:complete len:315 (+) Transcript_21189:37-981(+)|eukprot:CAMPEP_0113935928 /NCGR_PEP_ID=MMETSP1339-20121228/2955_1 /TAXON_ID=94617 /ORGANISM="Fibrocapsa japonica" /LENGTH=314 /DNA_ID=CAMNT_0000938231 /DNA_START=32 /DNA_END=976 /DNA_ORIENTATION=+ /assembly_acc=CAM_ASM_000762
MAEETEKYDFSHLLPPSWKTTLEEWLHEDIPSFDIGGFVVGEKPEVAVLLGKADGMIAGCPFFEAVFEIMGCKVDWIKHDGDVLDLSSMGPKVPVAYVSGSCRHLLMGERTALNIIQRCSGVATIAHNAVELAKKEKWHGMIAGTRKTTPGFRLVEKYGLIVAGAATHREDLSQMVMLKDNHVVSAGGITKAVKKAKRATGFSCKVEVECQSLEEAIEAAQAGAEVVMLDNFEPEKLKEAAAEVKRQFPFLTIEASGGITMETMPQFFSEHVDVISRGSLTYGYPCLDFSLKILPAGQTSFEASNGPASKKQKV